MTINWRKVVIEPSTSIKEALGVIDKEALRVALVVDKSKLVGMVTDGDVRRGLLQGIDLSAPVSEVMNTNPVIANVSSNSSDLKALMQSRKILSLPIVNDDGQLVGLKTLYDTLVIEKRENPIFIMAGGFGTRLKPLTDHCPKPMLKVGGKPMLETLINNFKNHGFYKFYISTHYLPEIIMDYFGNGGSFDVEITYVHEETPLGTGGALSLLPDDLPNEPLIMINGDILTNVDFSKILDFHVKKANDATMCVRDYEVKVPFGVVEGKGHEITSLVEKPTYRFFINAGIYIISNEIIKSLKINEKIDIPSLFEMKKKEGLKVLKFPIYEYWLDIGRMDDFKRAQIDILSLRLE